MPDKPLKSRVLNVDRVLDSRIDKCRLTETSPNDNDLSFSDNQNNLIMCIILYCLYTYTTLVIPVFLPVSSCNNT